MLALSDLWLSVRDSWKPLAAESPSEFAVKERRLHEIYCTESPGAWTFDKFPFLKPIMDGIGEAIQTGKRGFVFMASGQIGKSDAIICAQLWLKKHYPGPQLFMTATDDVADEFGRERFELSIKDCPSLKSRFIPNARGDNKTKRFTDGKIQLVGGQSIFKLISIPYRFVFVDEADSLIENLGGEGDPFKIAEIRMKSFVGETMMVAWGHPTNKNRGAGKLFYEMSDQRRPHVHHSCGCWFIPRWDEVKIIGNPQDANSYHWACPQCAKIIDPAEWIMMLRGVEYRSTLPPEIAAQKSWIGMQAGQLIVPITSLRTTAQERINCAQEENSIRVFVNKILGETHDPKVQQVEVSELKNLISISRRSNDPECYSRGQVPPFARFLTAGQDSRGEELHFAVWAWGQRRTKDGLLALCGWLVDWGRRVRQFSKIFSETEYHAFDPLIYHRQFKSSVTDREYRVRMCGHDIGWKPTIVSILRYCRNFSGRAVAVKGAAVEATNACNYPYIKLGEAMKFRAGDLETQDESTRPFLVNTYLVKTEWYSWIQDGMSLDVSDEIIGNRKVHRLNFPVDVDDDPEFLIQSANEELVPGEKAGELVWKKRGSNHYADCNTYALALALDLERMSAQQTAEEFAAKQSKISRYSLNPSVESDRKFDMG